MWGAGRGPPWWYWRKNGSWTVVHCRNRHVHVKPLSKCLQVALSILNSGPRITISVFSRKLYRGTPLHRPRGFSYTRKGGLEASPTQPPILDFVSKRSLMLNFIIAYVLRHLLPRQKLSRKVAQRPLKDPCHTWLGLYQNPLMSQNYNFIGI